MPIARTQTRCLAGRLVVAGRLVAGRLVAGLVAGRLVAGLWLYLRHVLLEGDDALLERRRLLALRIRVERPVLAEAVDHPVLLELLRVRRRALKVLEDHLLDPLLCGLEGVGLADEAGDVGEVPVEGGRREV